MDEVNLHRDKRKAYGRSTATLDYCNRSTWVAVTGLIAASQVATAAATGQVGLPGWSGNSHPKAYQK